jgi:peptidoglycan LD-endopeptidase LytH
MSPRRILLALAWLAALAATAAAADRVEIVWPTPNTAWAEGKPIGDYLQHAGSGDPASGGFGGVRDAGTRFHEGIDIKCVTRDRRGEPTDNVFAAMTGVVRHINSSAGDSNYGRYIVLEHPDQTPAVYTLYAHLARIAPGLHEGATVTRGQAIAVMGHSSGGYMIPLDRAHTHFEIGLMVTRDFETWYERKKFGSRNDHGAWNGMNLMGVDPLEFFNEWRAHKVNTFQDFFARMEPVVRVRIATHRVPDLITRYPSLLAKPLPAGPVAGWEIKFNWTGVPFAWTPLTSMETIGLAPDAPLLLDVNAALAHREKSKSVVVSRRGTWAAGKDLETVLQQMFGIR